MSLLLQKSSNHCNLWIEVKSAGIAFPNENIWLSFQRNIGDRNRGWLRCRERDEYVCRRSVWRRTVVLAFLFSFCLVFVSVFVIGDWNFVVDCLRYTRRTKQCFWKSICVYYGEMRYVVDVRNKTRSMHIAMFWVSCFFTRPILQQKWVRNDTSPFHILMQLGKLVGFGLLNRKALQKISKISVFNFLKWKKIQISRAQRG